MQMVHAMVQIEVFAGGVDCVVDNSTVTVSIYGLFKRIVRVK